jgi:hypothetical protein
MRVENAYHGIPDILGIEYQFLSLPHYRVHTLYRQKGRANTIFMFKPIVNDLSQDFRSAGRGGTD